MQFQPLAVTGAFLVRPSLMQDERGGFARTYCAETFAAQGLEPLGVQCNLSQNWKRGTLRGMHSQQYPVPDPKLVRCTRGAILDVVVDIRPQSPTHKQWAAVELTATGGDALYVPPGCAHGFLTLTDDADVFYMMGAVYRGDLQGGVRWNDPAFGIDWPFTPSVMADRDRDYPDYAG